MNKRDYNIRNKWEKERGPIPVGCELHHIVPLRMGGTNDLDNLKIVTREEHAQEHLELYEKHGDTKDLCAYHMLTGDLGPDKRISVSRMAGRLGAKIVKENELGICTKDPVKRKKWARMGGKAAQKTLREKQISAYYDPVLKKEISSKGGLNGRYTVKKYLKDGYTEEEAKTLIKEIQRENGKVGGRGNKGFVWLTDGKINIKYTKKQQQEKSVEQFLKENKNFYRGRVQ